MSDVLRTLREARPEELGPDVAVDDGTRRAELTRAMAARPSTRAAGDARKRPSRGRLLPVWGIGLVGAAAAAALVATNLPSGGGAPHRQAGGPGGPAAETLDAKTVLLAAAEKADARPDRMRAYWRQTTISTNAYQAKVPGGWYTVVTRERSETWTPSKPGVRTWTRQQELGVRPAAPADEAAWRRAGSPSTFQLEVPMIGPKNGKARPAFKPFKATTAPGRVRTESSPLVDGDKVFWLGRNVTMKDLRALPGDPKRLKAALLRWYDGHDTESSSVPQSADAWLYRTAGGLVTGMPVRPEVRAAAFRMLAGLKTVRGLGKVKDTQGRTGDAIAMDERTSIGVVRHRLVIDRSTGNALADETVLVKPAAGESRPAGWLLGSEAVMNTEWTDSAPR
ncbi:CU044_5270 family protein [Actinomadura rubrisoli]|uniref:CU044_5270 family protein n=1 Tax=Actinomadura rubrisoli TaxID=2530368 RepID=A0A4R5B7Q6_9ACTN|nr:CU044_5270 family protein [Actinomadura rubrisoli]TDD79312.1 hypothetical protein E1298_28005 [Actinomadura rubrisoli]